MTLDIVEKLAGAELGPSSDNVLSFADQQLKLNTEKDAEEICKAIDSCARLESLVLEGNTLGIEAAAAIGRSLAAKPELQQLHGKDLFTGRTKLEIPPALRHLGDGMMAAGACLTVLDLSDNAVGPVGMDGLQNVLTSRVCFSLQQLLLNNNGWGPTGGERLADSLISCYHSSVAAGCPMSLRVFLSGRSRLENKAAIRLAHFFKLVKSMEKVVMPQNGIYHEGVRALAEALSENKNLQHLDLNDNLLTVKGAKALAASLPKMQQLKILNVSDCLLKAEGACAIAAALKNNNNNLEELHMGFNEVNTPAALAVLDAVADKPRLRLIQLDGNQLGEAGVAAVQHAAAADPALINALQDFEEDEGEPDSDEDGEYHDETGSGSEHEETQGDTTHEDTQQEVSQLPVSTDSTKTRPPVAKQCELSEFLCQPTTSRFMGLSGDPLSLFQSELDQTKSVDKSDALRRHLALLSSVCRVDSEALPSCHQLVWTGVLHLLLDSAISTADGDSALLSNTLLVYMGLIKCEDKKFCVSWDLKGMLKALTRAVVKPNFPAGVKDNLKTFLIRPNKTVDLHCREKSQLLQALYQC